MKFSFCNLQLAISSFLGMILSLSAQAQAPAGDDLEALQEKFTKAAMLKTAPSVVQIQTSGGLDVIASDPKTGAGIQKGVGPTTGLVVAPDGFIISSSFNFAHKPAEIFVAVPGKKDRFVAKVVAADQTRMLTLLKIDADNLPVPAAVPRKEIKVGQWSLALGRTWANVDSPPSVSVGIISALDRIWGKALQTDAKISPVNYGGPLVDIHGRVQGVLVPASPRAQDETAGHEWYDSGIGFAIPLEDIFAVLPRLKKGENLKRGLLGITPKSGDLFGHTPEVGSVAPESAAAAAGIRPGDVITEIDGTPVVRQAQIMHLLGRKYEGDTVSVKVKRGADELSFPDLKLSGELAAVRHAFLGILPMRDDPEAGVEVRYVYPKSPAAAAGLKTGDRILAAAIGKDQAKPILGRDAFLSLLNALSPGKEIKLEVRRQGAKKNETMPVQLAALPDTVPEALPESATLKKALDPPKGPQAPPLPRKEPEEKEAKKAETGLLKRTNSAGDRDYWIYVPDNYDPNISHALLVWLHPVQPNKEKDAEAMVNQWSDFCKKHHLILLGPRAVNESGWLKSEADFVRETVKEVLATYTIDRQRIVAHGMGMGGELAFYLGFLARDSVRGVATVGAAFAGAPKENVANQRLSFFLVAGGKDPRAKAILETRNQLLNQKFSVVFEEVPDMGYQYLDAPRLQELVRWLDALDRL